MKSGFSTCAKRRSLLAIIAIIAVIGFMALPLTGCSEPEPTLERIDVTTPPTKTVYAVGEALDTTGMVVMATYSDGSTVEVADYTTDGFDSATAGAQTVTVTYQGKEGNFTVTVNRLTVATPTASLAAGTYLLAQSVTLSTITEGAAIYYTLDGTTPSASSTPYTTAISISATTTLKAIAVKANFNNSSVLTITYNFSYTLLTADTWADGSIASGTGNNEQWFKFTATAASQYIQFLPGTSTTVYVTLFDADGVTKIGLEDSTLSSSTINISRTTTVGNTYYIRVKYAYSAGTYSIGFNDSTTQPPIALPTSSAIALSTTTWTDGSITTAGGEQWFKFTASATASQNIFLQGGSLTSVYVRLYDGSGLLIGAMTNLDSDSSYSNIGTSRDVTNGSEYYIRVTPYNTSGTNSSGTYKIGLTIPAATVTSMPTVNTWYTGSITTGGEQWFKFTATATTQYIHFQPGTGTGGLTDVYVQLYTTTGGYTGARTNLYGTSLNTSRSLTVGTEYYIRIRPYYSTGSGTYKIGFNTSSTAPTN